MFVVPWREGGGAFSYWPILGICTQNGSFQSQKPVDGCKFLQWVMFSGFGWVVVSIISCGSGWLLVSWAVFPRENGCFLALQVVFGKSVIHECVSFPKMQHYTPIRSKLEVPAPGST